MIHTLAEAELLHFLAPLLRTSLLAAMCAAALLAGCTPDAAPPPAVYEVQGSADQRIAAIAPGLLRGGPLPTALLDAQLIQYRIGDGVMGPSDHQTFTLVSVPPHEIDRWTRLLTPMEMQEPEHYVAPSAPKAWWVTPEAFGSLSFYEPGPIGGDVHGWIGVSRTSGRIYVFGFTT